MILLDSFEQAEAVYCQRIVPKLKIGPREVMKWSTDLRLESIRKMAIAYIVSRGYKKPPHTGSYFKQEDQQLLSILVEFLTGKCIFILHCVTFTLEVRSF